MGLILIISGTLALYREYQTNTWPPIVYNISCLGNEASLFDCAHSLMGSGGACGYDASVVCRGEYLN